MKKPSVTTLNISVSVFHQVFTAICRLILARIILKNFGSENNGLMQSIEQILAYTMLLEGGIGGVMRASLYKPLAEGDMNAVSDIFNDGKRFFGKLSSIFIIFAVALAGSMKFFVQTEFDWFYVATMVIILGTNTFFNYYFALMHRLLMTADQKLYMIQIFQIISTALNLTVCIAAVYFGANLHTVKILTIVVSLIVPAACRLYVRKHYVISKRKSDGNFSVPQKRDAVIHHLSYVIHKNTDVVMLSLFGGFKDVSIYAVYHSVILMLEQVLVSVSSGISSKIGELWARREHKKLNDTINIYEVTSGALSCAAMTVCMVLILPFVMLYTDGVNDANYYQPLFALFAICASLADLLGLPYKTLISAAGHYKQTKVGAIVEVSINLGLSFILIHSLGLVGVAIGTLVAMAFRLLYSVWYLSKAILNRPKRKFFKFVLPNLTLSALLISMFGKFGDFYADSILQLFVNAVKVSLIVFPLFAVMNLLIFPKLFKMIFRKKQ